MTARIDRIDTETAIDKWIVISQQDFKLWLLRRLPNENNFEVIATYDVAVGTEDYPTPSGRFVMLRKAKYPDWHPPDREWVGDDLRDPETGKPIIVPGTDPRNPIRGAFLDIGDGIGIHGTNNVASIGTRASHGCIRVTEDEALELYRRVHAGAVVEIS
jgi:lipoprotein-anchoring transpeptidase ErfK/SrfK